MQTHTLFISVSYFIATVHKFQLFLPFFFANPKFGHFLVHFRYTPSSGYFGLCPNYPSCIAFRRGVCVIRACGKEQTLAFRRKSSGGSPIFVPGFVAAGSLAPVLPACIYSFSSYYIKVYTAIESPCISSRKSVPKKEKPPAKAVGGSRIGIR
jgi:hypothetical protein